MSRRLPAKVNELLSKSRDSALQAITAYNDPRSTFRSGTYTVLMIIAWTSLFHAYFEKRKIQYFYRINNGKNFRRVDGDKKAWELSECLKEYYKTDTQNSVRVNIELFIKLRNKIEHRNLSQVDNEIVGECQSLLINYDTKLCEFSGNKFSIGTNFFMPIHLNPTAKSIKKTASDKEVIKFIQSYRSSLTPDSRNSQEYQFKVFLVPNIGNQRSSADLAIQFVNFDENNPEEMSKYNNGVVFIKNKAVLVANSGHLKPGEVVKQINKKFNKNYSASSWHAKMWKKYKVRPPYKEQGSTGTMTKYCIYDDAHNDYVYTSEWVDFLTSKIDAGEI